MIFEKVMNGITKEEALSLLNDDNLAANAERIRKKFCSDDFDRCSIINGKSVFESGANAAISGDMLTTSGITAAKDREMLTQLGFSLRKLP